MAGKRDTCSPHSGAEHEETLTHIPRRESKLHSYVKGLTKLLIMGFAIYGCFALSNPIFPMAKTTTEAAICNCGTSVTEAKSKDCKFDSLATAWLPPACRDDELTAEFERVGPLGNGTWPYYSDLRKEHLLSVDELAAKADSKDEEARRYYVTSEWFVARCLFYWRKIERAKTRGTTIEKSYLDNSTHGHDVSNWHHCSDVYLARIPRDQIAAAGVVGFGDPVD